MAVSPLIVPPGSAERSTATSRSKLSVPPASNGTTPEPSLANNAAGYDLAEQMNEEEKNKYVKGVIFMQTPFSI